MSWDWKLNENGDIPLFDSRAEGDDLSVQILDQRLGTTIGEYPLDLEAGLPIENWTSGEAVDLADARARIFREIAASPGIASVTEVIVTLDVASQSLDVQARAVLADTEEEILLEGVASEEDGVARVTLARAGGFI